MIDEAELLKELFRDDLRMAERMCQIGHWSVARSHLNIALRKLEQIENASAPAQPKTITEGK